MSTTSSPAVSGDLAGIWAQLEGGEGRECLRFPDGSVDYRTLAAAVRHGCAAFDALAVAPGARVVIVTTNEAVAAAIFLAALLDGRVPVMLAPDSGRERVAAVVAAVEAALVVHDATMALDLPRDIARLSLPASLSLLRSGLRSAVGAWLGRPRLAPALSAYGERAPLLPPADDELAYLLFTSGTTSTPSGVEISRRSLLAHLATLRRLFGYDRDSRLFNATPLAHTDGLVQGLLLAVANGATLLRPGPFVLTDLEAWLDRLAGFGATHFITNPTVLGLVMRFATHDDYFANPKFHGVISSASVLRPALWRDFEARFGCRLFNLYGMTETVANATYAGPHPEMGPVGTIGVPVDCEVRLVPPGDDPAAAAVADTAGADEGEIWVRGDNVFRGYWRNPRRSAEVLPGAGWMRTGDLARRRADGALEITGRIKTMINMGGQSVSPEEIDEVLAAHPMVTDVATVALDDAEFGEIAVSAVVLAQSVCEADLAAHCRARLERLKVPKRIVSVERIPRGDAGKPRTVELRQLLQGLLDSGEAAGQGSPAGQGIALAAVCALAAEVFRVPVEALGADSSPQTVEVWDSFSQLSLIIGAEERFDVSIPASRIAAIRTLGDLHQTLNASP